MKHYTPQLEDYVKDFPSEARILARTEDIRSLEVNQYFFDSLFPMWYCSACYPELTKSVSEMNTLQSYELVYDADLATSEPDYFTERHKAQSELKSLKATKREEFFTALKQISICSKFDWELHKQSAKHLRKEAAKPVPQELHDVKGLLDQIKKQITALELSLKVSGSQTAIAIAQHIVSVPSIDNLVRHSSSCVNFLTDVSKQTEKTQFEEQVEICVEKILTEKAGKIIASEFAKSPRISKLMDRTNQCVSFFSDPVKRKKGKRTLPNTTFFEVAVKNACEELIDETLLKYNATIIGRIEELLGEVKNDDDGGGDDGESDGEGGGGAGESDGGGDGGGEVVREKAEAKTESGSESESAEDD